MCSSSIADLYMAWHPRQDRIALKYIYCNDIMVYYTFIAWY